MLGNRGTEAIDLTSDVPTAVFSTAPTKLKGDQSVQRDIFMPQSRNRAKCIYFAFTINASRISFITGALRFEWVEPSLLALKAPVYHSEEQ